MVLLWYYSYITPTAYITYDFFFSSLAVISKGIRCSRTDFMMKMLIAVDILMPVDLQNCSNSFFKFSSKRMQIVVCAMVYTPILTNELFNHCILFLYWAIYWAIYGALYHFLVLV